jgi:purine-nucleoside/S-methyl-5'-thioadenosine phosphorylase / adenosine deaminase
MEAIYRPADAPDGVLVAVSVRASAPSDTPSPTAVLARRFADSLGYPELPIVRATQVHGSRVIVVSEAPAPREVLDAGECDALVTALPGVGLAVQTADCVPVLLAAEEAMAAVHAGWRGASTDVVGRAVEAFFALIGPCCYEVGPEVAERFPGGFARRSTGDRFLLDLPGVVRSQLERAGMRPENVTADPACTKCGGARFASYRRDRERAGRMIALVARL